MVLTGLITKKKSPERRNVSNRLRLKNLIQARFSKNNIAFKQDLPVYDFINPFYKHIAHLKEKTVFYRIHEMHHILQWYKRVF